MKLGMHAGQDIYTSQYASFTTWLGQPCLTRNVFGAYDTWAHIGTPIVLSGGATATWLKQGPQYQEVIAIGMCPFTSVSSSGVTLAQVAAGAGDTYWTALGNAIKTYANAYQSQIVLRLGWEMNGDWYQWGFGTANASWNTITDFVAAWKRIVPLIRANAPNVRFEWCPAAGRNITNGLNAAYPSGSNGDGTALASDGKPCVDIIGLDVYDSYNTGWPSILNGGNGVITGGLSGFRTFAQGKGKPEAYTEWGCVNTINGNQDNPTYISGMYFWLNTPGANIDHHGYWNTYAGGPNAAIQGSSVGVVTGSISGTTLTLTSVSSGSSPAKYHYLYTADPTKNVAVLGGTQITAGSGMSFTVNNAQTVPSQTMYCVPVPKAAQRYKTLFGSNARISVIAAILSGGRLVPASTPPTPIFGSFCDGKNFYYAY